MNYLCLQCGISAQGQYTDYGTCFTDRVEECCSMFQSNQCQMKTNSKVGEFEFFFFFGYDDDFSLFHIQFFTEQKNKKQNKILKF